MNLFEFEGKDLLRSVGITVPKSQLFTGTEEIGVDFKNDVAVKAQVLSGKRFKRGLVKLVPSSEARLVAQELLTKVSAGEKVEKVLIEDRAIGREQFLSITYDTSSRAPVVLYSDQGGVDIESGSGVEKLVIDLNNPVPIILNTPLLSEVANKLWTLFWDKDLRVAEINPLVELADGSLMAADAKIIIDDDALFRHEEFTYSPRQLIGHEKTEREIAAGQIDATDYRGSAGSVYYDLDGGIAVLASGGGASVVAMDALMALGGKPANYTEYSGNPPGEKVAKLTEIALSKPGLKGCWVVGGTANFTDIYETLAGFLAGLRKIKPSPTYPIVIRRGGPRDGEAFEMLKEASRKEGWAFSLYGPETPMTETAKIMVDLIAESEK